MRRWESNPRPTANYKIFIQKMVPLTTHLLMVIDLIGIFLFGRVISPTHKRTEGRAPVWGSELLTFKSKDAALQGGSAKFLLG
jgi:hypothetical protein